MTAVVLHNLKKMYANGVTALNGIDLQVNTGDFFALLGQNGAGKSTTIGILSSLITKTSGTVTVFGYDLDRDTQNVKDCMGVVPQEMNFSIFEKPFQIVVNQAGYYGVPKKIAERRAKYYLQKMGIWEKAQQASVRLSGGMKRRLLIARALVTEPKLLILDEPTAGVDIELRYLLWDFLKELNERGTTIILTTHYLEEAEKLCKHVAIIDQGDIIESASMKSLMQRLQSQTILLDLVTPIDTLPMLPHFPLVRIDDTTLEVQIAQQQSINDLFALLTQHNIRVASVRNKTNRLEELFVRLIAENK